MQAKLKPVLVVTKTTDSIIIPTKNDVIYLADTARLFPAINELQPSMLVLDHDYLGDNLENILRRIHGNPFYNKIKICCYKPHPHTRVDSLLTALGVQHFIYADDKQNKTRVTNKMLSYLLDGIVSNKLADAS